MIVLCICKRCGHFAKVDMSGVLTSNPPQYAYDCYNCGNIGCVTERELIYETAPNFTATADISTISVLSEVIGIPCLICGETVPAKTMYNYEAPICEKCKKAVLKMREVLDNE